MKLSLPRIEFVDALSAIQTIVGGRTPKPILGCVRLATSGDVIELGASDGEASLRLNVPAFKVERGGSAAIPSDRLLSITREMPDSEIALECDGQSCTVRGVGSKFKIFTFPVDDFPALPQFADRADLVLDAAMLQRMIARTIFSAARETGRYAINGVLWQKIGRRLFLVATDGRRLSRAGGGIAEDSASDFQAIVPVKALRAFERVFNPPKERSNWTIDVQVMPNQILLRGGDRQLGTALAEGHFPKYEDVIPKDLDCLARISRVDLLSGIRRAALLTSDEARAIRLSFSAEQLVISAQSAEQGEARVELPMRFEGKPAEIGFNANFLADVLGVLTLDEIFIEIKDGFRPAIVRGEDRAEFQYVVMPVSQ